MGIENKTLAVAALAIIALGLAYYFLVYLPGSGLPPLKQTSYEQFIADLTAANKTYIMMDLRNANQSARSAIMSCGVDLAGSVPLAPKNVSVMVLEDSSCITESGNRTALFCEALSRNGVSFQIVAAAGNSTVSFYTNRMVIALSNYNSSMPCSVNEVQSQ